MGVADLTMFGLLVLSSGPVAEGPAPGWRPPEVRLAERAAMPSSLGDASRRSPPLVSQSGTPGRAGSQPRMARNWIQRHPACFGSMVGFAAGFIIGFLPGDDAVFDDFTASFNGAVLGGTGAGAGALIGWSIGRARPRN